MSDVNDDSYLIVKITFFVNTKNLQFNTIIRFHLRHTYLT